MKRARKGFTLVEVTVVLVIIAIIAAIAVPSISGYIDKSKRNNCQSVMTNLVNDLQYKVVSRRYYDVSELNKGLLELVKSEATEVTESSDVSNPDGKFEKLTETISSATGICPNGGKYEIEWRIKPGGEKANSAEVEFVKFECDCPSDGTHQQAGNAGNKRTAALISDAEYVEGNLNPDDLYTSKANEITDKIIADMSYNPTSIKNAVESVNNQIEPEYHIAGVSVSENYSGNRSNIEWICIDHRITNGSETDDDKSAHVVFTYSEGVLRQYAMSNNDLKDHEKWPSAEGHAGSYLWLEDLNYENRDSYQIGKDTYRRSDTSEYIVEAWIQRDGNWYVQKNEVNKGIDDFAGNTVDSEKTLLKSSAAPSVMQIISSGKSGGSFTDSFAASVLYNGKSNPEKITAISSNSDTSVNNNSAFTDTFFVKNGFIIISDESEILKGSWADEDDKYIDWTGTYSSGNEAFENYKKLKQAEAGVIDSFINGTAGSNSSLTFAYQEWYKYPETDESGQTVYKAKLITFIRPLTKKDIAEVPVKSDGTADTGKVNIEIRPDGNGGSEIVSKGQATFETEDGKTVPVNQEVKIPLLEENNETSIQLKDPDKKDIIINGQGKDDIVFRQPASDGGSVTETTVGTIESKFNGTSIVYSDKDTINKFDTNDITIQAEYSIEVKDCNNKVTSVTDKRTVEHMTSGTETSGYYFKLNGAGAGYADDADIIAQLNAGTCEADIWYRAPGVSDVKIGTVSTAEKGISVNYEKDQNDSDFDVSKVTVSAVYELKITSEYNTEKDKNLAENAEIVFGEVEHISSGDSANGWYISDKAGEFGREDALINGDSNIKGINKGFSSANIYYHQAGVSVDKHIGTVETALEKITAEYSNTGGFTFDNFTVNAHYSVTLTDVTIKDNHAAHPAGSFVNENTEHKNGDNGGYVITLNDKNKENYQGAASEDSDAEKKFKNGHKGTVYVVYSDGNVKYTSIDLDISEKVKSKYVAYPVNNSRDNPGDLYIAGYAGTIPDLDFPDEITGYWLKLAENETAAEAAAGFTSAQYEEFTLSNNDRAVYINDGKTHPVKSLGKVIKKTRSSSNMDDITRYMFIAPSDCGSNSITVSGGIPAIGSYFFKGLTTGNFNIDTSEKNALKEIGSHAFETFHVTDDTDGITIPATVTDIGECAFEDAAVNKGPVKIYGVSDGSSGNGTIESGIFKGMIACGLEIGGAVKHIGDEAFAFDDFTSSGSSLTINSGVETIGDSAFEGVVFSTGSLAIPDTVTDIGNAAFRFSCFGKEDQSGRKLSLSENLNSIGAEAFRECFMFEGNLEIPEKVTKIGSDAFYKYAEFSEKPGILEINGGTKADNSDETILSPNIFAGSRFTGLKIGGNVTKIGDMAFQNVKYEVEHTKIRHSVSADEKVKEVIDVPYAGISGDLVIGDKVREIGKTAFSKCTALTSVEFGTSLEKIGNNAFDGCKKIDAPAKNDAEGNPVPFTVPDSITEIGNNAFRDCSGIKKPLKLSSNLETIGAGAFENCLWMTGNLVIPESVELIGSRSFLGCNSLTGLTLTELSDAVNDENNESRKARIGIEAFRGCTNMKGGLTIPEHYTGGIGNLAFMGFGSKVQYNDGDEYPLVMKAGSYSNGHKVGGFIFTGAQFRNIEISGRITEIDDNAFHNSTADKLNENDSLAMEAGDKDTRDAEYSLDTVVTADYTGLSGSVSLLSNVGKIGTSAFENCTNLSGGLDLSSTSIIGDSAFSGCTGLSSSLYLSKDLIVLGDYAFQDCSGLTGSVSIGPHVKNVGIGAFKNCSSFNGVLTFSTTEEVKDGKTLVNGVTAIGAEAFNGCIGFTGGVTVPVTVESIGEAAFVNFAAGAGAGAGELHLLGSTYKTSGKDSENVIRGIGSKVFTGGKFNGIYIGGAVNKVDTQAFDNLTAVNNKTDYPLVNGRLFIDDSVISIGDKAFGGVKFDSYVYLGTGLEEIGSQAFDGCSKVSYDSVNKGLTINNKVKKIGRQAFNEFGSADHPGELTILGYSQTFGDEHIIGFREPELDDTLFEKANFRNITIGGANSTVNTIGYRFMKSEDVGIKNFDYSGIKGKLTIDSGVKKIMGEAFNYTGIDDEVHLENASDLVEIGVSSFEGLFDARGDLEIPPSVHKMGVRAFKSFARDTAKKDAGAIGELIVNGYSEDDDDHTLGYRLFSQAHFNGVSVGGEVKTIGKFAFYNSDFNTDILNEEDQLKFDNTSEALKDKNGNPYNGYLLNNKSSDYSGLKGPVTIGPNVTKIDDYAFAQCTELRGNLVLSNCEYFGMKSFFKCGFDGKLSIDKAKIIENEAFSGCSSFYTSNNLSSAEKELVIPETVTELGEGAFYKFSHRSVSYADTFDKGGNKIAGINVTAPSVYIKGATSVSVKENGKTREVVTLTKRIFPFAKFNNVKIGGNVEKIDPYCFNNREGTEEMLDDNGKPVPEENKPYKGFGGDLKLGNSVSVIGEYAFLDCERFNGNLVFNSDEVECILDSKLKSIGTAAFTRCKRFSGGLTIPESVESIGRSAFKEFASEVSDDNAGTLVIEAGSDEEGTVLRNTASGGPIFSKSKFNGVTIGGKVKRIDKDFLNNWQNVRDEDGRCPFRNGKVIGGSAGDTNAYGPVEKDPVTGEIKQIRNNEEYVNDFDYRLIKGDLIISDSVKEIGEYAFLGVPFHNVTINENVEIIGDMAFMYAGDKENRGTLRILGSSNGRNDNVTRVRELGSVYNPVQNKDLNGNIFMNSRFGDVIIGGKVEKLSDKFMEGSIWGSKATFVNTSVEYEISKTIHDTTGSLKIGEGVREIGKDAFWDCSGFRGELILNAPESVVPNTTGVSTGLEKIGENAFSGCTGFSYSTGSTGVTNLEENDKGELVRVLGKEGTIDYDGLVIPLSVKSMGPYAFKGFSSKSATPGHLWMHAGSSENGTVIDPLVFSNSKFNGVYIGDRVNKINDYAFSTPDSSLTFETVRNESKSIWKNIYMKAGLSADDAQKAVNGLAPDEDTDALYTGWKGELYLDADSKAGVKGIEKIGSKAFYNCSELDGRITLDFISETEGINTIGEKAFYKCSKISDGLRIPPSVTSIGNNAFCYFASQTSNPGKLNIEGCAGTDGNYALLSDVTWRTDIRYLKADMFNHSQFRDVSIGWRVEFIPDKFMMTDSTHDYTGITGGLYIGSNILWIGDDAFNAQNVTDSTKVFTGSLSFGESFSGKKRIGNRAFKSQKFTGNVRFPHTVSEIGESAFQNVPFTGGSIEFVKAVNELYENGSVNKQEWSVDKIEAHAFEGCKFTGNLVLPEYLLSVGDYAFRNCTFTGNLDIKYIEATSVKYYNGREGHTGLEEIGKYAFENCTFAGTLTIPKSVGTISEGAFKNCSSFTGNLSFPYSYSIGIKTIGKEAFYGCSGFNGTLTLQNSLTSVGEGAFRNCSGLTGDLIIPDNLTKIEKYTFMDCWGFNGKLNLNKVTEIGEGAFARCKNITGGLTIPQSMNVIGRCAFKQFATDAPAGELKIFGGSSNNGTVLGSAADPIFPSSNFRNVYIGGKITEIGEKAFYSSGPSDETFNHDTLKGNLYIGTSVTKLNPNAFGASKFSDVYLPTSLYSYYRFQSGRILIFFSNGKDDNKQARIDMFGISDSQKIHEQNVNYTS